MPKSTISWGVLFFSLGVILFGSDVKTSGFSANLDNQYHIPLVFTPTQILWTIGSIAVGLSVFLIISSFWTEWFRKIERFVKETIYPHGYAVFGFVYVITYLKSAVLILSTTLPTWIGYLVLYPGYAFIWILIALYIKEIIRQKSGNFVLTP